jgi:hypothetical protein
MLFSFNKFSYRCSCCSKSLSANFRRRWRGATVARRHCTPDFLQFEHGKVRSHLTFRREHNTHERTRSGLV